MKKTILTIIAAAATFAAFGQGTVSIANNKGATIYPILLPDGSQAKGANYSVEVFAKTMDPANKIGPTMILGGNGRFAPVPTGQVVPGVPGGQIADLIARAWDNTTGNSYDTAVIRGFASFKSDVLGDNTLTPPSPALPMVTGKVDGFTSIKLEVIPEPSTIALGALGAVALLLRRRK